MEDRVDITKIRKEWKQYRDFKEKKKNIGKHKIYLFGGTNRGAIIIVRLNHKDKILNYDERVYFMNYINALVEYRNIKSTKDMLEIIERNA